MAFSIKGKLGIPDSRFAAELGKSATDVKFAPELEEEYDVFFLAERRSQVRSFNGMVFVLSVLALLLSFGHDQVHDSLQRIRLSLIVLGCITVTWAAFSRLYQEVYLGTARWASLVIAVFASFEMAHRAVNGQPESLTWLTAYGVGLFFMAGARFGAALQANLALLASLVAGLLVNGASGAQILHLTGIVAVILMIAGFAYFQQAVRYRKGFLERGLIADLAARDGLTGLKNRRAFDEHLIRCWQQSLRDRKTIAVMFIDVDAFKKFNDRYGHKAGDIALQRIAGVVHSIAKRALDLAARYGGEELAVILYDVPRDHAAQLAEAMRIAVMNLGIEHLDGTPLNVVTISIGVGIVRPTLARSPDGAVQLADEALYAAKRNGRNRVELFESEYDALSTGTFRTALGPREHHGLERGHR
jgi:diguanylate cyclase (GGDEF)-like protein